MPPRTSGALSNGLMSLKFMQRALAPDEKPVKAEAAEIVDDSKWVIERSPEEEAALAASASSSKYALLYYHESIDRLTGSLRSPTRPHTCRFYSMPQTQKTIPTHLTNRSKVGGFSRTGRRCRMHQQPTTPLHLPRNQLKTRKKDYMRMTKSTMANLLPIHRPKSRTRPQRLETQHPQ